MGGGKEDVGGLQGSVKIEITKLNYMMSSHEAWKKQSKTLEYYKINNPSLIIRKAKTSEEEVFNEIGVMNIPQNKPKGYFRLYPQDFIVEEVTNSGDIIRINKFYNNKIGSEVNQTFYAILIKIGIPTNIAIGRISKELNIELNKIGYSGLKDADAITAQLVAFPGINIPINEIKNKIIPNVYLTNFYFSKGSLNPGDLDSNIFTITIRTDKNFSKEEFAMKIETIRKYGVLNYFQSQRFGGLRLISHKLGKLLMQGDDELALKYFLFKTNKDDIPLVVNLRKEAEKLFPRWSEMKEVYEKFPYTFFNELRAMNYLIKYPDNLIGALIEIKDQTQLWAYAYSSWLFNKYLSEYSKNNGCINEKFPTLLSENYEDYKIYRKFLVADNTMDFIKNLRPFKFIQLKKRLVDGRIFPQNINYKFFNGGVVLNFILPKGSYATTMLANIFELEQGLPIPEWVNKEEIDPKEILGDGDIKKVKETFKDCWYSKVEEII